MNSPRFTFMLCVKVALLEATLCPQSQYIQKVHVYWRTEALENGFSNLTMHRNNLSTLSKSRVGIFNKLLGDTEAACTWAHF